MYIYLCAHNARHAQHISVNICYNAQARTLTQTPTRSHTSETDRDRERAKEQGEDDGKSHEHIAMERARVGDIHKNRVCHTVTE